LERLIKSVAKHDATFVITPHSIKPFKSLLEKIYDRGKKAENITDVIRCAILCREQDDVEEVVRLINRNHHVYEHEIKEKGGDKTYGYYGSHHFLIKLKHGGFLAEIQVMTNRLWAFKTPAHQIYEKYRAGQIDAEFEKAKRESKMIFQKGNLPVFKKY
jgi:ppGpp synthetase/RelA/SpoT-type nucleotidyltranferase